MTDSGRLRDFDERNKGVTAEDVKHELARSDLRDRLHLAIFDPVRIVEREKAGDYVNESLMEWQYRAVCKVMEETDGNA